MEFKFKKTSLFIISIAIMMTGCNLSKNNNDILKLPNNNNDLTSSLVIDSNSGLSSASSSSAIIHDVEEIDSQPFGFINGNNHLLKNEDSGIGILFTDYSSLINYQEDLRLLVSSSSYQNGVYDDELISFIDQEIEESLFTSYNLLFSKELIVPDSSFSHSLTKMYLKDGDLHLDFSRISVGYGYTVISYDVFIVAINKNVAFNNIITSTVDDLFGVIE